MNKNEVSVTKYWDLSLLTPETGSIADAAQTVRSLLKEAVSSQIVSDVPFGCLLSGGIDSSTVTHFLSDYIAQRSSTASKDNNQNVLHTYSLQLPEYDEHFQVGNNLSVQ